MRKLLGLVAAAAALAAAAPASAAQTIETIALFQGYSPSVGNNAIQITDNIAGGTVKVQVTAWTSTTPGYWNTNNGHIRSTLGLWEYGVGSQYSSSDSHTVDNTGQYDFILLQFDKKVALNTVTFTAGWDGYDSDATISHATINFASGQTYKSTGSTFWNAASTQLHNTMTSSNTPNNSYVPGQVKTSKRQVNPTLVTSNVWLISAKIGSNDTYKDAFKVKGFTYINPYDQGEAVPEPATWAMLILGMGFVGGAMRRRTRARLALA